MDPCENARSALVRGGLYALCFCEESGKKGGKDTPSACLKSGEKGETLKRETGGGGGKAKDAALIHLLASVGGRPVDELHLNIFVARRSQLLWQLLRRP